MTLDTTQYFSITTFTNDAEWGGLQGVPHELSLEGLRGLLHNDPTIQPDPKRRHSWSAGLREGNSRAAGSQHYGVSCLALDVDGPQKFLSDDQIAETIAWAKSTGLIFISHTTYNRGLRVVFPMTRVVSDKAEYSALYKRVSSWAPVPADPAAKDLVRINFLPAVPTESARETHKAFDQLDGRLLDPSTDFGSANPAYVAPERAGIGGALLDSDRINFDGLTLTDVQQMLAETKGKQTVLYQASEEFGFRTGRDCADESSAKAQVVATWEAFFAGMNGNTTKPVDDWDDAYNTFEGHFEKGYARGVKWREQKNKTAAFATAAQKFMSGTPVPAVTAPTASEPGAADVLMERLREQAAASDFEPRTSLIPTEPNYAVLGSVSELIRKGRIALAARILGSHGWSGQKAAEQFAQLLSDIKPPVEDFAGTVDRAASNHEGPPVPFNDFDVCRFMRDVNASNSEPTWLYNSGSETWYSRDPDAGYVKATAGTAWSEACQLAERPELRRAVDESTLLSAAYRDSFMCEQEITWIDQPEPVMYDSTRRTLVWNSARLRRELQAKRSERYEQYCAATLPADQLELFTMWLAGCADFSLKLPCVIIFSVNGVGKTVLAGALARLLRKSGGYATDKALMEADPWSDEYLSMPIICSDESISKPTRSQYTDTNRWKTVTYATEHQIRERNKNNRQVHGCIRHFICINEPKQLGLPPNLVGDESTIKALGQRALVLTPKKLTEEEYAPFAGVFEGDEIAEHCLWLHTQHAAELHRRQSLDIRGAGLSNGESWFRAWAQDASTDGFTSDALVRMMSKPQDVNLCGNSFFDGGVFWTTAADVAAARGGKTTQNYVARELTNLTGPSERKSLKRKGSIMSVKANWFRITRDIQDKLGFVPQDDEQKTPTQQAMKLS
jgi:hypothetical protein